VIERGQVCWLEGARAAARRPVLVLQADAFIRSVMPTVLVAPLAQDLTLAEAPGTVLIPATQSGLGRDTVLVLTQLGTTERTQLRPAGSRLERPLLGLVDYGLKLVLAL